MKCLITNILLTILATTGVAQVSDKFANTIKRGNALYQILDEDFPNKEEFVNELNYSEATWIRNGNIVKAAAFSTYLQKVFDRVKPSEGIKPGLELFVFNSSNINAYSYPNGSVFITLGLLNSLQSEEELAFVLAHEIAHIYYKHGIKSTKKQQELKEQDEKTFASIYKQLTYSKEQESEADIYAAERILEVKYNPKIGINALNNLEVDSNDFKEINFNQLVGKWDYKLDSSKAKKSIKKESDEEDEDRLVRDDRFTTHPNVKKRIQLLTSVIERNKWKQKSQNTKPTEFYKLQTKANIESINNSIINGKYGLSLYMLLKQNLKANTKKEHQLLLLEQLYLLNQYNESNSLRDVLDYNDYEGYGEYFKWFLATWQTMPYEDSKEFVYLLSTKLEELNQNDEDFIFWNAIVCEQYFGKVGSRPNFKKYKKKFPNGKYISSVNARLNEEP